MEDIEGCAYQQLWSWSDYSYKEFQSLNSVCLRILIRTPVKGVISAECEC